MYKNPLELDCQELKNILFTPLKISIGPVNSEEVIEIIEGQIIDYDLSGNIQGNPAYKDIDRIDKDKQFLPTHIVFSNNKGVQKLFNIFEVKLIELIERT